MNMTWKSVIKSFSQIKRTFLNSAGVHAVSAEVQDKRRKRKKKKSLKEEYVREREEEIGSSRVEKVKA